MRRLQNSWDGNRLFERLHALDKAVAAVNELQTLAPFETIVRVSADVGMSIESFLTPRLADELDAGIPLLDYDAAGKMVRRLKLFNGRFTLEWPYHKHTYEKGGVL
ncbi:MAG: hypothetical protein ACYC5H_08755 [Methylovirgula sp.]